MRIYIYAIWFPTSKKYYIGQTCNLKARMKNHFYSGSLVYYALWKYDDWKISILHTCKTRDEAYRIEIEEIRNYNSIAPNGYNLTRGGDGSFSLLEETLEEEYRVIQDYEINGIPALQKQYDEQYKLKREVQNEVHNRCK